MGRSGAARAAPRPPSVVSVRSPAPAAVVFQGLVTIRFKRGLRTRSVNTVATLTREQFSLNRWVTKGQPTRVAVDDIVGVTCEGRTCSVFSVAEGDDELQLKRVDLECPSHGAAQDWNTVIRETCRLRPLSVLVVIEDESAHRHAWDARLKEPMLALGHRCEILLRKLPLEHERIAQALSGDEPPQALLLIGSTAFQAAVVHRHVTASPPPPLSGGQDAPTPAPSPSPPPPSPPPLVVFHSGTGQNGLAVSTGHDDALRVCLSLRNPARHRALDFHPFLATLSDTALPDQPAEDLTLLSHIVWGRRQLVLNVLDSWSFRGQPWLDVYAFHGTLTYEPWSATASPAPACSSPSSGRVSPPASHTPPSDAATTALGPPATPSSPTKRTVHGPFLLVLAMKTAYLSQSVFLAPYADFTSPAIDLFFVRLADCRVQQLEEILSRLPEAFAGHDLPGVHRVTVSSFAFTPGHAAAAAAAAAAAEGGVGGDGGDDEEAAAAAEAAAVMAAQEKASPSRDKSYFLLDGLKVHAGPLSVRTDRQACTFPVACAPTVRVPVCDPALESGFLPDQEFYEARESLLSDSEAEHSPVHSRQGSRHASPHRPAADADADAAQPEPGPGPDVAPAGVPVAAPEPIEPMVLPEPLEWVMVDEEIALDVATLKHWLWACSCPYMLAFNEARGVTNVRDTVDAAGLVRTLQFRQPNKPLIPASDVTEIHTLKASKPGGAVIVAQVNAPEVPFGSKFTSYVQYAATHLGPGRTRLRISAELIFDPGTWGWIKVAVRKGGKGGLRSAMQLVVSVVRECIDNGYSQDVAGSSSGSSAAAADGTATAPPSAAPAGHGGADPPAPGAGLGATSASKSSLRKTFFHKRKISLTSTRELEIEQRQYQSYVRSYSTHTDASPERVTALKGTSPFDTGTSDLLLELVVAGKELRFIKVALEEALHRSLTNDESKFVMLQLEWDEPEGPTALSTHVTLLVQELLREGKAYAEIVAKVESAQGGPLSSEKLAAISDAHSAALASALAGPGDLPARSDSDVSKFRELRPRGSKGKPRPSLALEYAQYLGSIVTSPVASVLSLLGGPSGPQSDGAESYSTDDEPVEWADASCEPHSVGASPLLRPRRAPAQDGLPHEARLLTFSSSESLTSRTSRQSTSL